jgi:hypothetical protein
MEQSSGVADLQRWDEIFFKFSLMQLGVDFLSTFGDFGVAMRTRFLPSLATFKMISMDSGFVGSSMLSL